MLSHMRDRSSILWLIKMLKFVVILNVFASFLTFASAQLCFWSGGFPLTCLPNNLTLTELKESIKDGALNFSSNLAKELVRDSPDENLMVSPFSVYRGLVLMYQGAGKETEYEFGDVLGLREQVAPGWVHKRTPVGRRLLGKKHAQEVLESITRNLRSSERWNFDLNIANAIFVQDGMKLKNEFREDIRYSGVEVQTVNFSSSQSTQDVNEWISDKTKGRASRPQQSWFDPGNLFAVFVNVFYFDATWANGFDLQWTKKEYFDVGPLQLPFLVDMMHNINRVPYYRSTSGGYTAIGLPLVEESFVMYFIRPEDPWESVEGLIEILTPAELKSMARSSLKAHSLVDYRIPRVKFATRRNLNAELKKLGIRSAFDKKEADFSDMMNADYRVYLSAFGHSADFRIGEKGAVAVSPAFRFSSEDPIVFTLNRPFVVVLYHAGEELVLSYGVVHNPLLN